MNLISYIKEYTTSEDAGDVYPKKMGKVMPSPAEYSIDFKTDKELNYAVKKRKVHPLKKLLKKHKKMKFKATEDKKKCDEKKKNDNKKCDK